MAPSQKDVHDVSVYWFRNALRLHDNPSLLAAARESKHLLLVYVIDPEAPFCQTAGLKAGAIRANFVLESLREMDAKLRELQSRLYVVKGSPERVLPEVVASFHVSALFYEKEAAAPIRENDAAVLAAIQSRLKQGGSRQTCEIRGFETHNLHSMETYLSHCKNNVAPATFGGLTKIFQKLQVPKEVDLVTQVPPLPDNGTEMMQSKYDISVDVPSLEDLGYTDVAARLQARAKGGITFEGGEDAGLALMKQMMARSRWIANFEKPKTSPNALSVDTTGLSPYVKHGCVSPRRFYHELSKVYAKFNPKDVSKPPVSLHGQLMWREYNNLMGYSTPNFDRMADNPVARQIPWDDDPELLAAWRDARTGYPFIDAIMTQLRETGWIHHLARHAVACFLTRGDLWQSWEKGAAVFEERLIDADWSINNFNWQWLSCTAHFYQYFRCYSPESFGKKTDPNGDYIRKWLPQFKDMPKTYIYSPWEAPIAVQRKVGVIVGENYPYPVVEHKIISKDNMGRMKEAYNAQKQGDPMPEPPQIREENDRKRQRVQ